ncbi:MAG: hypothetical protein M3144_05180, partial [Actinomycetota bacterium]|nr:hypothetical protein [Actinomycetota bacterium]
MTLLAVLTLAVVSVCLAWTVLRHGWAPAPGSVVPPEGVARLGMLAGAVLVPIGAIASVTSTSGFVWDDIKNLREAQLRDLTLDYLFEPTSGHFAPGHRLGDWVVQRLFDFNFTGAQVLMLIGFAACLLLFHRILAELFRPGPGPLLITLLFGASVVNVGVVQWWASGLDRVPATFLSFVSILGYLRYYRTRSWGWVALSVASLAAAFMFYVKPVFVPLYLALIRLLLLEPTRPVRETAVALLREWKVWAVYGVTVAVLGIIYVQTYPTGLNEIPTVSVFFDYLSLSWFRVVVPNLFGLYIPMLSESSIGRVGVAVGQLALVATIAWSIARTRAAWRAWAFFAVGFVSNIVIVGMTRIGFFSARIIAYTLYYNLEITFLFFLALAAAFLPVRGTVSRVRDVVSSGAARIALGVGVATYLAFSWHGSARLSDADIWIGRRARAYTDNFQRGLEQVRRSGAPFALVDGAVPRDVVPYLLVPYNSASEVFPLIDDGVGFDAAGRELYDTGTDGRVQPVAFIAEAGGEVRTLIDEKTLAVVGGMTQLTETGLCVDSGPLTATVAFTPPSPLEGYELHLNMVFSVRNESVMSLLVDPIGGHPPGRIDFRVVNLHAGPGRETVFGLDEETMRSLAVVIDAHTVF